MEEQPPLSPLEELNQINRMHGDIEAQYARWKRLWQEHLEGDKLRATELELAYRITFSGILIAQQRKRYQDANALGEALETHPDFAQMRPRSLATLYAMQMQYLLQLGEEARAAEVGHRLLPLASEQDPYLLYIALFSYVNCVKSSSDEEASPEFTHLVEEVVKVFAPEAEREPLPERATYAQLDSPLRSLLSKLLEDARTREREVAQSRRQTQLKCHCGQPLSRQAVLEQGEYSPRPGDNYIYLKFRCSHCRKLGEHFVRQEEWQESLLAEPPEA